MDYWDQWLRVKVERDREKEKGWLAVYLAPEGDDYPNKPTLWVEDDTYPTLGHLGWAVVGAGTELFVDSIEARLME